ncbi:MAG: hypothetical protein KDB22_08570 [Planctomycetales bacterium]|nr:hypothetical protein [Planctomycetales bacterium]
MVTGFSVEQLAGLLRRCLAVFALALIAVTYKLWFVSTTAEYPQIPWFEFLADGSFTLAESRRIDWLLTCLLLASLILATVTQRLRRTIDCIAMVTAILLVSLDQQRLQPWMYQLMIALLVFTLAEDYWIVRFLRWLVISIYGYSALGKLDTQFIHTVGREFLDALLGIVGLSSQGWHAWAVFAAVLLFPVCELALAICLAWQTTRRAAALAACVFHTVLIVLFSPAVLGHSWGVLVWNAQFLVQAIVLFFLPVHSNDVPKPDQSRTLQFKSTALGNYLTVGILGCVMILPLSERWAIWDHWPSWALYAPHTSRTEIQVARTVVDRLPSSLRQWSAEPPSEQAGELNSADLWANVPIDRWCLEQSGTPMYPQSRVGIGVARWLAAYVDSEFEIRVQVRGPAGRFTGQREIRYFQGRAEIDSASDLYWCNTTPRPIDSSR